MLFCQLFNAVGHYQYQILTVVVVNIICLGAGTMVGWLSPSLLILMSKKSPLDEPLTIEEAPWVGSLFSLAAIGGTLGFGLLANYTGTKVSLLICSIPLTTAWIWIYFADDVWHLYMARISAGLTLGASFICIPLFVAEIANDNVRGKLSSLMIMFFNLGILLGYIAGKYLSYETLPKVMIGIPIMFFIGFVGVPNTPQFLLKRGQFSEAENSLRFYRNNYEPTIDMETERRFQEELDKLVRIAEVNKTKPAVEIKDFLTPTALKGMLISPFLMAVAQFSGTLTLISYAATIFGETGSTIDPDTSSIVLGSVQLVGTIAASILIDRLGRKILLIVSTSSACMCLLVIATYTLLNERGYDLRAFNLLPVVTFSVFIFVSAIGITPVPYVIASEVLSQKIRQIGATICTCTVSVYAFIILLLFPWMLETLGLAVCLYMFSCVSFAGLVFTLFVVEETKGKNLDQLDEDVEHSWCPNHIIPNGSQVANKCQPEL